MKRDHRRSTWFSRRGCGRVGKEKAASFLLPALLTTAFALSGCSFIPFSRQSDRTALVLGAEASSQGTASLFYTFTACAETEEPPLSLANRKVFLRVPFAEGFSPNFGFKVESQIDLDKRLGVKPSLSGSNASPNHSEQRLQACEAASEVMAQKALAADPRWIKLQELEAASHFPAPLYWKGMTLLLRGSFDEKDGFRGEYMDHDGDPLPGTEPVELPALPAHLSKKDTLAISREGVEVKATLLQTALGLRLTLTFRNVGDRSLLLSRCLPFELVDARTGKRVALEILGKPPQVASRAEASAEADLPFFPGDTRALTLIGLKFDLQSAGLEPFGASDSPTEEGSPQKGYEQAYRLVFKGLKSEASPHESLRLEFVSSSPVSAANVFFAGAPAEGDKMRIRTPEHMAPVDEHGVTHLDPRDSRYSGQPQSDVDTSISN